MTFAVVFILGGATVMVAAGLAHRRAAEGAIDDLLAMTPFPLADEDEHEVEGLAARAVELAGQVVERVDQSHSLGRALEQARIPLRPGEFVIIDACGALGVAALVLVATNATALAVVVGVVAAATGVQVVRIRITRRRRAFEAQLPDALSLIASSLSAGHTFLRSIQMMCEESGPPMAEEFALVVAETQLGDSLVDAVEHMAARVELRDMDMVVQAIRIQQTVGGRLADLLHTLADFIRSRHEVRREVQVLTAEGRMSAYVLAGLVPFLFGMMEVLNPSYAAPLFHGAGLAVLAFSGVSVFIGLVVILRMVKIDI